MSIEPLLVDFNKKTAISSPAPLLFPLFKNRLVQIGQKEVPRLILPG